MGVIGQELGSVPSSIMNSRCCREQVACPLLFLCPPQKGDCVHESHQPKWPALIRKQQADPCILE